MKKAVFLLAIVLVLTFVSVSRAGGIFYVDVNGPNDPGTGTSDDPFRKIQDAINDANDSDIIEIRPGIYTGPGNYNLDPNGLSITIRSIDPNDSNVVANTIIDPNEAGRGFYFDSGEDANCIISGLTIQNGHTGGKGGGIYCYYSSPTITNCIISDNSAGTHGGGLFCQNSSPQIIGCVISGNTSANDGGGIEHWRGKSVLTNCIISDNLANGVGGGADYFNSDDITLVNCTFAGNWAGSGGAIYCWGSDVAVENSILWANEATQGSQVALDTSGSVSIDYSDVQGGEASVYDPGNGLVWDGNNIDTDPCFASFDINGDPNVWDFHLQSAYGRWDGGFYSIDFDEDGIVNLVDFDVVAGLWTEDGNNLAADLNRDGTVDWLDIRIFGEYFLTDGLGGQWVFDGQTSECIDAGDVSSDLAGEPWPNGKRINMGAYGGTSQASKNGSPADFDVSNHVDFVDYALLAEKWMTPCSCIEDLTGNGVVDFLDLEVFVRHWLWEK